MLSQNLIFISNSIPKSGSTLLFNLQRDFFKLLFKPNAAESTEAELDRLQIDHAKSYIIQPHSHSFIDALMDGKFLNGPHVLKVHTPFNGSLRDAFLANENVYASLIIRDPVDVFLSAQDNFQKTGEFSEFKDFDSGVRVINNYFEQIYRSIINTGYRKPIPIVRYEDLLNNPIEVISSSFSPELWNRLHPEVIANNIILHRAEHQSIHRKALTQEERIESRAKHPQFNELISSLYDVRAKFGYVVLPSET